VCKFHSEGVPALRSSAIGKSEHGMSANTNDFTAVDVPFLDIKSESQ